MMTIERLELRTVYYLDWETVGVMVTQFNDSDIRFAIAEWDADSQRWRTMERDLTRYEAARIAEPLAKALEATARKGGKASTEGQLL